MKFKLRFLFLVLSIITFSCKRENQSEKYTVRTVSADVRNDSIYLFGNYTVSGNNIAEKMGFVVSPEKKPDINSLAFLSDNHDDKSDFKIVLSDNFIKDSLYYVRAAIQSDGYVYYGNEMSFVSNNLNLPRIDNFTPTSGTDNEYVKIYGTNFSDVKSDVSVMFGIIPAEVVSSSLTRILVKIPAYKKSGYCKITVKIKSNVFSSLQSFFLYGPVITDFSPGEGGGIVTVTINGTNFSDIPYRNTVYVGEKIAEIMEASANKIVVKVNLMNYLPDSYPIFVIVNDKIAVSDSALRVVSPWKQLASLPVPGLAGAVTFRINNKIYLCTGTTNWNNTGYFTSLFLEYDISTDTWTKKANFPGGDRDQAIGFSIGEKGYLGLGEGHSTEVFSDFWEYDPSSDSWTRKSDFPGGGRRGSTGFSYNNIGYVLMGPCLTDFWSYIPGSDTWQRLPDFISNSISVASVVILHDKVYVIGGQDWCHGSSVNNIWCYDLVTKEWKFISTNSFYLVHTFYADNNCYIINSKNELFEFLPESNSLTFLPIFPGAQRANWQDRGSGLIYNGKIYYGAGSVGGYGECSTEFWSFDLN